MKKISAVAILSVLGFAFFSVMNTHASDVTYKVYTGQTAIEGATDSCQLTIATNAKDQIVGFQVTGPANTSYPVLGLMGAEEFKNVVRTVTEGALDATLFQAKHFEVSDTLFGNLAIEASYSHDFTFEGETLKVTIKNGEMTKFKYRKFSYAVFFPALTVKTVMECRNLVLEK